MTLSLCAHLGREAGGFVKDYWLLHNFLSGMKPCKNIFASPFFRPGKFPVNLFSPELFLAAGFDHPVVQPEFFEAEVCLHAAGRARALFCLANPEPDRYWGRRRFSGTR
jgi:hypothetical protein